jgi:hypothetical protein
MSRLPHVAHTVDTLAQRLVEAAQWVDDGERAIQLLNLASTYTTLADWCRDQQIQLAGVPLWAEV